MPRLVPIPLTTARLTLEPLTSAHATGMAVALADPSLYAFTGGEPPSVAALTERYRRLEARTSPDGSAAWLNWALRLRDDGTLAGYVQATVSGGEATVAWVVSVPYQGRGIAVEATGAMVSWLRAQGVVRVSAWIHPDHAASAGVARRVGLAPTGTKADGEIQWTAAGVTDLSR